MASLRDKTISGVFWSFLQKIGSRGIGLVTTIVLARILTPRDFGLIGMLTIFIVVSQTLVQAGFSQALIQKKDADEEDYSSVFYINLVMSIVLYAILFFSAPLIAKFYNQPILTDLTRVLALVFVINAFSYVQEAKLTKEMRFKTLMFIHLPSTIISGVVAVFMALEGFGVWSIIALQLIMRFAYALQIWIYSKWKPMLSFNRTKAKGLFSFGSRLMVSAIIQTVYDNIYLIVIGKFFSVNSLGYYQNAQKLVYVPSQTLSGVLSSVTFPAFASIQDDNHKLKEGYRRVIQQLLFWLCPIFVLAAILAKPLFSLILTDKWLSAVPFFQLLCVIGIVYPLNSYNVNLISIKGRTDIVLKLQIIKKTIAIIGIAACVPFGIWPLVIFQAVNAIINYFFNSYYAGHFIEYPTGEQIRDILPVISLSIGVGFIVFVMNNVFADLTGVVRLMIGFGIGGGLYWIAAKLMKFAPYVEVHSLLHAKLKGRLAR